VSETVANLAQKNARNALQRVDGLEQEQEKQGRMITHVIKAVNESLGNLNGGLDTITKQLVGVAEVLDAVVRVLGSETIDKVVNEQRAIKAETRITAMKDQLTQLITAGTVKPSENVAENSLMVFKEYDKDGKELPHSRVQFTAAELQPQFRGELMGKGAGTRITSSAGNSFELLEVYEVIAPPQNAPNAAPEGQDATPPPAAAAEAPAAEV
jgi:hypothetical protein